MMDGVSMAIDCAAVGRARKTSVIFGKYAI